MTSRLLAALVQDTEVTAKYPPPLFFSFPLLLLLLLFVSSFFGKSLAESAADFMDDDIRLGEGMLGAPTFQAHEKALSDVEIRLQKELKDLGLFLVGCDAIGGWIEVLNRC